MYMTLRFLDTLNSRERPARSSILGVEKSPLPTHNVYHYNQTWLMNLQAYLDWKRPAGRLDPVQENKANCLLGRLPTPNDFLWKDTTKTGLVRYIDLDLQRFGTISLTSTPDYSQASRRYRLSPMQAAVVGCKRGGNLGRYNILDGTIDLWTQLSK